MQDSYYSDRFPGGTEWSENILGVNLFSYEKEKQIRL